MSKRSIRRLRGIAPLYSLQAIVRRIYERSSVGCCMHVVLDDGNIGHSSVKFCAELAREQDCDDCIVVARILGSMTVTQRKKALSKLERA